MLFGWYVFLFIPLLWDHLTLGLTYTAKARGGRTILVDKSGKGQFSSVQSAIDSIPSNNKQWVAIHVKAGTYREKVNIPSDKPFIIIRGEGKRKTKIEWGDHSSTSQSPTFHSSANYTIAKSITFANSFNYPPNKNVRLPAVAARISGDRSAFYRCGFEGLQDTLWDDAGRHYFKQCTIKGSVDFIFGGGQSIYDECSIQTLGGGFITAQARNSPNDPSGFVFIGCNVTGIGPVCLGRAWRQYSRVLFYKSKLENIIEPKGWDAWNFGGHENDITYAEHGNYGPGAGTSKRVKWLKNLRGREIEQLTSLSFINAESWMITEPPFNVNY